MTNFIIGCAVILIGVGSIITSSEHSFYGKGYPIVHWILGFVAGVGMTVLTMVAIYK